MRHLLFLLLVLFPLTALARPGQLRTEFGIDGRTSNGEIRPYTSVLRQPFNAALQPDGKMVVVGYGNDLPGNDLMIVRYLPDGFLDPSFNPQGTYGSRKIATTPIYGYTLLDPDEGQNRALTEHNYVATGVALQPDGKILIAGASRPQYGRGYGLLARLNADGSLDTGFGDRGYVKSGDNVRYRELAFVNAASTTAGDEIVVSGVRNGHPALFRFDGEGQPIAATEVGTIGGEGTFLRTSTVNGSSKYVMGVQTYEPSAKILRFLPDGSLDTAFGDHGIAPVEDEVRLLRSIAVQPDGKIVAAGCWDITQSRLSAARVCANGYKDNGSCGGAGFGTDGVYTLNLDYPIAGQSTGYFNVLVQPNGYVLLTGVYFLRDKDQFNGTVEGRNTYFVFTRLLPEGIPDPEFSGQQTGMVVGGKVSDYPEGGSALLVDGGQAFVAIGGGGVVLEKRSLINQSDLRVETRLTRFSEEVGGSNIVSADLTNRSPDAAENIVLEVRLDGLTYVPPPSFTNEYTCQPTLGGVDCYVGNLARFARATVTMNFTAAGERNRVRIKAKSASYEVNPEDNDAEVEFASRKTAIQQKIDRVLERRKAWIPFFQIRPVGPGPKEIPFLKLTPLKR